MWKIEKVVSKGEYDYAVVPNHPKATKNNYVLLHRIILENYLDRLLEDDEIPHHIDEDKKNNNIENLELCLINVHAKYHMENRGRVFCLINCAWCGEIFEREKRQLFKNKNGIYYCCKSCGTNGQFKGWKYSNNLKFFKKYIPM